MSKGAFWFGVVVFLLLVFPISVSAYEIDGKYVGPLAYKILQCESSLRVDADGDVTLKYPAKGIAQFQERTFNWMKHKAHKDHLTWLCYADQVELLQWALRHHMGKYWTCYRILRPAVVIQ